MQADAGLFAGKSILVVEDDYRVAVAIKRRLEGDGAVVIGPTGLLSEALRMMATEHFDAALLDVRLDPEISYFIASQLLTTGKPFLFVISDADGPVPQGYPGFVVGTADDLRTIAERLFLV